MMTKRWLMWNGVSVLLWVAAMVMLGIAYGWHPPIWGWRFWLRIAAGLVIIRAGVAERKAVAS